MKLKTELLGYDLKQAVTYFTKYPDWIKTYVVILLVTYGINFSASAASKNPSMFVAVLFLELYCVGYVINLINRRIFKPNAPMYEITNIKKILSTGAKGIFGLMIWMLLFFACIFLFSYLGTYTMLPAFQTGNYALGIITMTLITLPAALLTIVIMVSYSTFWLNLKFSSFFKFKAIFFILKKDGGKEYFIRYGITAIFLSVWMSVLSVITLGLCAPWLLFAMADINAQMLRKIFNIGEKKA